jgi:hypothetical protein
MMNVAKDQYSERETRQRMENAIRRAQKTPHKPTKARLWGNRFGR